MNNIISVENIKNGKIHKGDCQQTLKLYPENSIDRIITDPPYGLKYYGLNWDKALPPVEVWKGCLRVLKPGRFAFIMSAVRQDLLARMIIMLEDAGFKMGFTSLYWSWITALILWVKKGL